MIIGIVGGGIGGLALAIALQRHGIGSIVFEKDTSFNARSQGYGLTMQQGGRAISALGLMSTMTKEGQTSSSHFIFNSQGQIVLFWGTTSSADASVWQPNRNCHISRQRLRNALLQELDPTLCQVLWGFEVSHFEQRGGRVVVFAGPDDARSIYEMDGLVACDGIRSGIRHRLRNEPLKFLGTFVILGIFEDGISPIFRERMVQMSDGLARIFIMPYDAGRSMWQLSFPMELEAAVSLARSGAENLRLEALRQCRSFHPPIPELLARTEATLITGYPVYDREPMATGLDGSSLVTLLGDAAHPMSPFKGQGANQALIDAVDLAEAIARTSPEQLAQAFREYERRMILRTTPKVLASRAAISSLHCAAFVDSDCQLRRRGYPRVGEMAELLRSLSDRSMGIWSSAEDLAQACSLQNKIMARGSVMRQPAVCEDDRVHEPEPKEDAANQKPRHNRV
ncbi:FAD-binding monooxygenase [Polychytrium aggregatum]|uniref:FAD-binding monooxygenase n=1 Tax=Polychytrium aggregatum TaxID=110093 RepID=UPI0022FDEAB1|nr:FAD-binding monooxygenase [Polychytrium aggregatum]KAI9206236.1 FAD-binding monooxygenase [Polychytrium aggregatum]